MVPIVLNFPPAGAEIMTTPSAALLGLMDATSNAGSGLACARSRGAGAPAGARSRRGSRGAQPGIELGRVGAPLDVAELEIAPRPVDRSGEHLAEGGNGNPFYAQGAPSWPYLLWVACWFLIVLTAAVASFERREL